MYRTWQKIILHRVLEDAWLYSALSIPFITVKPQSIKGDSSAAVSRDGTVNASNIDQASSNLLALQFKDTDSIQL